MSTHTRVLIVNADGGAATALLHLLGPAGYQASLATDLEQAEGMLERADADVVLLSLDVAGLAGVTRLAAAAPEAELVMLADAGQAEMAREGLRLGACDVVARTGDACDASWRSSERVCTPMRSTSSWGAHRA
jgi:DNA-binding NtrC family response regulator